MENRPRWEILVGETRLLDYLARDQEDLPHPMQKTIEAIVNSSFTEEEREVFYLRYGEGLSIREIGKTMLGYVSNNTIQSHLASIEEKVRNALKSN